jgi:hypothetical protein
MVFMEKVIMSARIPGSLLFSKVSNQPVLYAVLHNLKSTFLSHVTT